MSYSIKNYGSSCHLVRSTFSYWALKIKLIIFKMRVAKIAVGMGLAVVTMAVDSVVDVGYSRYRGRIVGDGTTQWLGIRYAAPPLGNLRFADPAKPQDTTDIQDASKVRSE
jgi:hypothetical protein